MNSQGNVRNTIFLSHFTSSQLPLITFNFIQKSIPAFPDPRSNYTLRNIDYFFQNMKIVTRVTIKVNFRFCVCNHITFHQRLQRKISSMVLCCRLFIISTIINHKTFLVFTEKLRLRKMYFVMYHNRRLFYDYLHSPCS